MKHDEPESLRDPERRSIRTNLFSRETYEGCAKPKIASNDEEAIKNMWRSWDAAWNRHDMQALTELTTADVDFITVGGKWLRGRTEFEAHHARLHHMQFKDSTFVSNSIDTKFLREDVAVVHVNWGIRGDRDPDGAWRAPREGIFTLVMTARGGKWLIAAAHNTNTLAAKSG